MKYTFQLFAIVISTLLLVVPQANATVIIFDIEVAGGPGVVEPGDQITVDYDESEITGTGDETLSLPHFSLDLILFGQSFDETNDIDYPGFPELSFFDGNIVYIDFIIAEFILPGGGTNTTEIINPDVVAIAGDEVVNGVWQVYNTGPTAVPLPGTMALLGLGLASIGAIRRKRGTV